MPIVHPGVIFVETDDMVQVTHGVRTNMHAFLLAMAICDVI